MIKKAKLGLAAPLLLGIGAFSPAAHAGGTISACPTTVNSPGTWKVTNKLTATFASGACIFIAAGADGATIDLGGFTITGPGSNKGGSTYGVGDGGVSPKCSPCQSIVITNGTVKGFEYGILLENTKNATITKMDVLENADGVVDYNPVVIASSHANDNSDYGMYLINAGNTVAHSQANNNGVYGMALWGGDNSVVDSEASNNKASNGGGGNGGITLGGVGNSVIGTTANNNVHTGIALNCPSDLYGNTASGNGSGDIVLAPISKGCARLDNHPSP